MTAEQDGGTSESLNAPSNFTSEELIAQLTQTSRTRKKSEINELEGLLQLRRIAIDSGDKNLFSFAKGLFEYMVSTGSVEGFLEVNPDYSSVDLELFLPANNGEVESVNPSSVRALTTSLDGNESTTKQNPEHVFQPFNGPEFTQQELEIYNRLVEKYPSIARLLNDPELRIFDPENNIYLVSGTNIGDLLIYAGKSEDEERGRTMFLVGVKRDAIKRLRGFNKRRRVAGIRSSLYSTSEALVMMQEMEVKTSNSRFAWKMKTGEVNFSPIKKKLSNRYIKKA